ncbi:SocA family protein [Candidatus Gottesmanbacteria bacterium]|nr:SocA family protein [Candidatus Gottesmanbacteria bacterium]
MIQKTYKLNEMKYKNAVLYIAKHIGKGTIIGKKKLYKLFYFLDFDFFEKYDKPFTGDIYHKLPMGPAPSYLDAIIIDMRKKGLIKIAKQKNSPGYDDSYVYQALTDPDLNQFTKEELHMLDRIIQLYGSKTGNELEKMTHKEAPYLAVREGEEIPLELAHYRGTFTNM